jgi:amino acid transporter
MIMNFQTLKKMLVGAPLPMQREKHERLSVSTALAVFASDALSSTAYATEEILVALAVTYSAYAGFSNFLSIPIAIAICVLMVIVVASYKQVIKAYDQGGGTYEVSKEHLGVNASHVAGAALLIDYVLTAAVSVCAGVDALVATKWVPPEQRISWACAFLAVITLINLRGVKESGLFFSIPAYIFIFVMVGMVITGLVQAFTGIVVPLDFNHGWHGMGVPANIDELLGVGLLLAMVKAFSHGCTALTGIEAISNGVKAFKEPAADNANKTMVIMGCILGFIFIGMTILAFFHRVMPAHNETVVSQVATAVFGGGTFLYYLLQFMTTVILIFAANTSFAGFPRLTSILANDGFLPRQLMHLGDRLVFSNGIVLLGVVAGALVVLYNASTHALIPLYAVGVFLSFTLAQAGMVKHHLHHRQPNWRYSLFINGFGALVTAIATIILLLEKFTEGAWLVVAGILGIVWVFRKVKSHYISVARQLILPTSPQAYCQPVIEHTVVVLVSSLHRGTLPALRYARTISSRIEAVHVELRPDLTNRLIEAWDDWGQGVPLTVLKSNYRSVIEPLMEYIEEVDERYPDDIVTVIIPEFVTKKFWHNIMHNQSSLLIKTMLAFRRNKVVTSVRYFLEE